MFNNSMGSVENQGMSVVSPVALTGKAVGGATGATVFNREGIADILRASGDTVAADRFLQCCEGGRGWVGVCNDCRFQVYHPSSCELRICPSCGGKRARALAMKMQHGIKALVERAPQSYSLKHVTLSTNVCLLDYIEYDPARRVLNVARIWELTELIVKLRVNVRKMFQEEFDGYGFMGGGIGVEFGPGGLMLHFHVLLLSPYYAQEDLQKDWERWSDGHSPGAIVYIRKAKGEDLEKVVGYVAKYVTKPLARRDKSPVPANRLSRAESWVAQNGFEAIEAALHFAFKGMRRFQTFGSFFNMELPPDEEAEVCPKCGGDLTWHRELDVLRCELDAEDRRVSLLKLLTANNLSEGKIPAMVQSSLLPFS